MADATFSMFVVACPALVYIVVRLLPSFDPALRPHLTVVLSVVLALALRLLLDLSPEQAQALFFAGTSAGTLNGLVSRTPTALDRIKKPKDQPTDDSTPTPPSP